MWRPFSSRSLFLLSLHSSSSSTTASPYFVPTSQFSSSNRAKLRAWWHFDNCNLPTGVELDYLPCIIFKALGANKVSCPFELIAFGDLGQLQKSNRGRSIRCGSPLKHIAIRGESPASKWIIDDITNWVSQNPPPAHLLLISSDEVFVSVLEDLRMKKYNILIANNNRAPDHFCGAATIMWHWNSIARGEKLIGTHINNPPHDSWYGHFKLPIENDFSTSKYLTSLNTEEVAESAPDSKVCPASESVSESRSVRVRVWWDLDSCNLPTDVNAVKVAPVLTGALKANGINSPIEIIAFGDDRHLSSANQNANFWTGIDFNYIPNGGKNEVFKAIVVDLMSWVSNNPPPVHLFVISGDGDFAGVLHRLRMKNYNILLACIDPAPDALCSAATIMWHWNSLVRGEKLLGKHWKHWPYPIDDFWYAQCKAPIEDALSTSEESTSLNAEEASK